MNDRSAVDTIIGYHYQFDHSIYSILSLPNIDDSIDIEVIEDIDVNESTGKTAVQCKYYAKTEYNHSVIKDAIMFMLSHFKEVKDGVKSEIKYKLYGHYKSGQDKLVKVMDIEYLKKNFLTRDSHKNKTTYRHHEELGLDDNDLQRFIGLLEIDVYAKDFESQQLEIIQTLMLHFKCNERIAECLHYNGALALIRKISIKQNADDRRISKKDFLTQINTTDLIFNDLFLVKKGKAKFYNLLKSEYFTSPHVLCNDRFFLIDSTLSGYNSELKSLVITIHNKYTKVKRELTPFCPYIFIYGLSDNDLLQLKNDLYNDGYSIYDGHDYFGATYNPKSISNKKLTRDDRKEIKILNKIDYVNQTLIAISGKTKEIYQFYIESPYFELDKSIAKSIKHIKIQVEERIDILKII